MYWESYLFAKLGLVVAVDVEDCQAREVGAEHAVLPGDVERAQNTRQTGDEVGLGEEPADVAVVTQRDRRLTRGSGHVYVRGLHEDALVGCTHGAHLLFHLRLLGLVLRRVGDAEAGDPIHAGFLCHPGCVVARQVAAVLRHDQSETCLAEAHEHVRVAHRCSHRTSNESVGEGRCRISEVATVQLALVIVEHHLLGSTQLLAGLVLGDQTIQATLLGEFAHLLGRKLNERCAVVSHGTAQSGYFLLEKKYFYQSFFTRNTQTQSIRLLGNLDQDIHLTTNV